MTFELKLADKVLSNGKIIPGKTGVFDDVGNLADFYHTEKTIKKGKKKTKTKARKLHLTRQKKKKENPDADQS